MTRSTLSAMAAEVRPTWHEPACEIGGCACSIWDDWLQARREFAFGHPRSSAIHAISDDDEAAEALDDLAKGLDGEFIYYAPPCRQATCSRSVPASRSPADREGGDHG